MKETADRSAIVSRRWAKQLQNTQPNFIKAADDSVNRNVLPRLSRISVDLFVLLSPGRLQSSEEQRGSAEVHCRLARAQACAMALSFKKDLDKYKDPQPFSLKTCILTKPLALNLFYSICRVNMCWISMGLALDTSWVGNVTRLQIKESLFEIFVLTFSRCWV